MILLRGDRVKIKSLHDVIRHYTYKFGIQTHLTNNDIKCLRLYLNLSEKKKYKIADYCRSCKLVWIEISKKQRLQLRLDHVDKCKPMPKKKKKTKPRTKY